MSQGQPIVLLIDDDPNDQELAKIALEKSQIPHRLMVARDGAEALAFMRSASGSATTAPQLPHLVLLDLKLPKVNGLEVLELLRAENETSIVPIVVFTSSNEERDLERSYELGANAYIRKPNDFKEYKDTVADMGRFWILRNQSPPTAAGRMTS